MNCQMRPGIILRHDLPRGHGTRHAASMQRFCEAETTVLDDAPVGEAIEWQVPAGLLVGGAIFVRLGGGGEVVELRRGVLNGVVIRNLVTWLEKKGYLLVMSIKTP